MKVTGIATRRWAALFLTFLLMLSMAPAALADTDENTPRITQQPDQLVLQLGTRWVGVEFELRTDAGRFPIPVVVDETGVLTMGGSSTYTLSCLESQALIPEPEPEVEPTGEEAAPPEAPESSDSTTSRLLAILLILLLVVIVVAVLVYMKRQRRPHYDNWEDDEDAL